MKQTLSDTMLIDTEQVYIITGQQPLSISRSCAYNSWLRLGDLMRLCNLKY